MRQQRRRKTKSRRETKRQSQGSESRRHHCAHAHHVAQRCSIRHVDDVHSRQQRSASPILPGLQKQMEDDHGVLEGLRGAKLLRRDALEHLPYKLPKKLLADEAATKPAGSPATKVANTKRKQWTV